MTEAAYASALLARLTSRPDPLKLYSVGCPTRRRVFPAFRRFFLSAQAAQLCVTRSTTRCICGRTALASAPFVLLHKRAQHELSATRGSRGPLHSEEVGVAGPPFVLRVVSGSFLFRNPRSRCLPKASRIRSARYSGDRVVHMTMLRLHATTLSTEGIAGHRYRSAHIAAALSPCAGEMPKAVAREYAVSVQEAIVYPWRNALTRAARE